MSDLSDEIARAVIDLVKNPDDLKQRDIRKRYFGPDQRPLVKCMCEAYGLLRGDAA